MELGLGLYARMLTAENLRFARQVGATAVVVHMADYRRGAPRRSAFDADAKMWDVSAAKGQYWTTEELVEMRRLVESEGLRLAALENINAALWHDVLLDGPAREEQLEGLKSLVAAVGDAGIPCLGYNFTLAGVWGTRRGPTGRGGASTVTFDAEDELAREPLPAGSVANRLYDPVRAAAGGQQPPTTRPALLERHRRFLETLLPVAERHGVVFAAHPDDPPVESLRGQPRFMHRERHLDELLEGHASRANRLQLCIGTVAEMADSDVYAVVDRFSAADRIGYIHFRNVNGRVPRYREAFVDDGDIDMARVISILGRNRWKGVLIPDHTPYLTCDAPWHAGMAYAMGFMRAAMRAATNVDSETASCSSA